MNAQRVRRWRRRWAEAADRLVAAALDRELEDLIVDVLSDEYRSGAPPTFKSEQVARIVSVACEDPKKSGRPVTHWTPTELALEAMKRKIVDEISPRHIARFFGGGQA